MAQDIPGTPTREGGGDYDPADGEQHPVYDPGQSNFYVSKIHKPAWAYPLSLKQTMKSMPFIHLNVVDPSANKRSNYAVALPMPTSVKVNYNANWESVDLGALTGALAENAKAMWAGGVDKEKALNSALNVGSGMGSAAVQNALSHFDEFMGTSAGAAVETKARVQVNPHAALRFTGMAFREFLLDFVLLPKNEQESIAIRNIIFQLKYAMHPEGHGGSSGTAAMSSYFSYPHEFIIGFYAPNLKNLFRTSPCALLTCTVEYNGAGVPAFYSNDKPVCLTLSLHFKENEILTKTRIKQGW